MVRIDLVRAWHPARPGDASNLLCPVYDTLSDEELASFASLDYNPAGFVPRPTSVSLGRFLPVAQRRFAEATQRGAFARDQDPSLYIYGIEYIPPDDIAAELPASARRSRYLLLGVVGALPISESNVESVAPHEKVFADRVAERVSITEATRATFAPILLGYIANDHRINDELESFLGVDRRRLAFDAARPALASGRSLGSLHRLWRISNSELAGKIQELLLSLRAIILDGHHRFAAARQRAQEGKSSAPLAMMVSGGDRALHLLPWHRTLARPLLHADQLPSELRKSPLEVEELHRRVPVPELVDLLHKLRSSTRCAFVAQTFQKTLVVHGPRRETAGQDFDLLHEFLDPMLQPSGRRPRFWRSTRLAVNAIDPGGVDAGGIAFLLPAPDLAGVERRAFDERRPMVEKSTMFLPKVAEGVVFASAEP